MSQHRHGRSAAPPVEREFGNSFPPDGKVSDSLKDGLNQAIELLLNRLHLEYSGDSVDYKDYTVYTGTAGIAYLYFHLYNRIGGAKKGHWLQAAKDFIDSAIIRLRKKGVSFLGGDAGPLAVGSVVYHEAGKPDASADCLHRLLALRQQVLTDATLPDEVLFGRSGYLIALLFVRRHLGNHTVPDETIHLVCQSILESGRSLSKREKLKSPLMFEWHEKKYLGAAHGIVGILHTLLLTNDEAILSSLSNLIRPTLDYLMTLKFPSGNYPSSIGSSSGDLLVHWCHGAPGWIHLFVIAYKVFGDAQYLDAARECAEVIWSRGLLKKGYGICHGVAGNAYGFLALYQLTSEPQYLYRASKFAEWCVDYGKHGCRTPDRPYSLFEGMAGTIYFLVDMLDPVNARFPAFVV